MHVAIARAIARGEAARAERMMREHMLEYAKYVPGTTNKEARMPKLNPRKTSLRRTQLITPCDDAWDMMNKAARSGTDIVRFELEDGVVPARKAEGGTTAVFVVNGEMIDAPHILQARTIMERQRAAA